MLTSSTCLGLPQSIPPSFDSPLAVDSFRLYAGHVTHYADFSAVSFFYLPPETFDPVKIPLLFTLL